MAGSSSVRILRLLAPDQDRHGNPLHRHLQHVGERPGDAKGQVGLEVAARELVHPARRTGGPLHVGDHGLDRPAPGHPHPAARRHEPAEELRRGPAHRRQGILGLLGGGGHPRRREPVLLLQPERQPQEIGDVPPDGDLHEPNLAGPLEHAGDRHPRQVEAPRDLLLREVAHVVEVGGGNQHFLGVTGHGGVALCLGVRLC